MYRFTAAIGSSVQNLQRFPNILTSELLCNALLELTVAYELLNARWRIENSIFWNTSRASTRFSIREKIEGMSFDAATSLLDAAKILDEYYDNNHISNENKQLWGEIIQAKDSADRWIKEDYFYEVEGKQLNLPIARSN
jgi:hypothetical protein